MKTSSPNARLLACRDQVTNYTEWAVSGHHVWLMQYSLLVHTQGSLTKNTLNPLSFRYT